MYGKKFMVVIDNNFLMYVLMLVKLDVIGYCWVVVLVVFDFEICYCFGCNNVDVDLLFRFLEL